MGDIVLSMVGITKSFGSIKILRDVALELRAGEVHALLGENGAGKSSLMKILMGVLRPDSGEYTVRGKQAQFSNPSEAQRNGVSMVYQEFGLVQYLSVTENILLGRLPARWGKVDWPKARQEAAQILQRLGSRVSPDATVGDLKVADQQEVEIARALSYDPAVFIMDEPSSALSRVEIDNLYGLVRVLKQRGVAIVYISHKLEEVFALADRVTILRDGAVVKSCGIAEIDMATLVERMTGKPVDSTSTLRQAAGPGAGRLLELSGFSADGLFEGIDLTIAKGTIVGIAGVIGAGKSELARAIVGALPDGTRVKGGLHFDGVAVNVATMTPSKARRLGIGFVSEDRQAEGIVQEHSVGFNIVLPALSRVTTAGVLVGRRVRGLVARVMDDVGLRPREPGKLVRLLSGGNQQKVVIGKWIAAGSKLLILDEPTRGIDVGARQEIYDVIRSQARERGVGVLLLSSDMREIMVASDRILIMAQGRITREVAPDRVSERDLLEMVLVRGDKGADIAGVPEAHG
ncbi:sugar ABC transporter ATP-binding protein [Mesorhizobium sp. M7A.F.Ca.CA.001.09.2.1]|uniref:Sugar ABC transporter ATP-binding protein n=1 Tax=Mesorhizobium ciceri TaxID=39645 RepID=A0AB38TK22_9HYPH|nr:MULTISPECIES: sugar ABC transporter ATP-binding protein [Mesorhizobium]RUY50488.1 sugar ABC transporter ATP-binding protein [Mesorhizobium sp. M7A.F.Ca.CA.001.13.2.1]RWN92286.1 MAG: sugar ABC transporter ATP-binding protein [Mesorhizobium sp.]MDF3156055.1 sugar ABC transporter ATP-binding protein [Mesorhizobium sp. XAP10]MDF3212156.1 sugar ABC transporter ATP-binding protein [Mesorhizobium ciceri]MDF3248930.1 sugar ABC transporter ATP-binding protein [Mesorhizobium sp. XAP4]